MKTIDMTHLLPDESLLHVAADLPPLSRNSDPPYGLFLAISRYAFVPDQAFTFFPCQPDMESIRQVMADLDLGADMVVVDLHQRFWTKEEMVQRLEQIRGKALHFNVANFLAG